MDDKLFLTPQEILNKEFKIDAEGYRPKEVDAFLDLIVADYDKMEGNVQELLDLISSLKGELFNDSYLLFNISLIA